MTNSIKKFTEPPFWDNFIGNEPLCKSLIENFSSIEKEALRLEKLNFLYGKFPVSEIKLKNNQSIKFYIITKTVRWSIAPLFGSRYDTHARRRASKLMLLNADIGAFFIRLICPKTYGLLKDLFRQKIVLNAYFTKASPGVFIKPHIHPISDGVHRMNIHLGIFCDPNATVTVGEETRTWEEGKLLAFKNTGPYRHSVVHNGTEDRVILIVELDVKYLEKYGVFKGERIIN
jgi:hypothetical protein